MAKYSQKERVEQLRQVAAELKEAEDSVARARKVKEEAIALHRNATARHRDLLAERQRLIVDLGIVDEMGPAAIAREAGMEHGKVSLYVNQARRELRDSA